jgi:hypothetical protein
MMAVLIPFFEFLTRPFIIECAQRMPVDARANDVTVLVDTPDPLRGILIYGRAEIDYDNIYEQVLKINETSFRGMSKEKLERITKAYLARAPTAEGL